MNDTRVGLYSALLRFLLVVFIVGYPILNTPGGFHVSVLRNSFVLFIILIMISADILFHVTEKFRIPCLIVKAAAAVGLYFVYDRIFMLIIALCILDTLMLFRIHVFWGLISLALWPYCGDYRFLFLLFTLLTIFLYYLLYVVVGEQKAYIESALQKEQNLLDQLRRTDKARKSELNRTILNYENQRLKEKSELSQNLHDKIGHAINGSIFKLEGAKLLLRRDTPRSEEMLGDVITALRESVDDIETYFSVNGDVSRIPSEYFGILLDNTVEALSNSLKYAACTRITASLYVYNKILRYTVTDNGVGADHVTENMGLAGMRERIASINGKLVVGSENGFTLNMLIPIPDSSEGGRKFER